MKIVSFNINGLRARPHQLSAIIEKHQPDVIGLQETKVADEQFPQAEIEALGYHVHYHGQKGHYGVALLAPGAAGSSQGLSQRRRGVAEAFHLGPFRRCKRPTGHRHERLLPQGESRAHPVKFPAKTKFYADLQALLEQRFSPDESLALMGDFNISPQDCDIGIGEVNAKRWLRTGKCSFLPEEREWLERIKGWGLQDSFRTLNPDVVDRFSWFDYRSRGFEDEPRRGLRIDYILTTHALHERVTDCGVDYDIRAMEKPSDHCPVWIELR